MISRSNFLLNLSVSALSNKYQFLTNLYYKIFVIQNPFTHFPLIPPLLGYIYSKFMQLEIQLNIAMTTI